MSFDSLSSSLFSLSIIEEHISTFESDEQICCAQCSYSFDDQTIPHKWPQCDHIICISCLTLSSHLWPSTCPVCNNISEDQQIPADVLSRVYTTEVDRAVEILAERLFAFKCSQCEGSEKQEKLRICVTCANQNGVAVIESTKLEKILPFIVCADCSIDSHISEGHKMCKYHNWKNTFDTEQLRLRILKDQITSSQMKQSRYQKIEEAEKRLESALRCALQRAENSTTVRQCTILCQQIEMLLDKVIRAQDILRPIHAEYERKLKSIIFDLSEMSTATRSMSNISNVPSAS